MGRGIRLSESSKGGHERGEERGPRSLKGGPEAVACGGLTFLERCYGAQSNNPRIMWRKVLGATSFTENELWIVMEHPRKHAMERANLGTNCGMLALAESPH